MSKQLITTVYLNDGEDGYFEFDASNSGMVAGGRWFRGTTIHGDKISIPESAILYIEEGEK